jgi:hypothetical protein
MTAQSMTGVPSRVTVYVYPGTAVHERVGLPATGDGATTVKSAGGVLSTVTVVVAGADVLFAASVDTARSVYVPSPAVHVKLADAPPVTSGPTPSTDSAVEMAEPPSCTTPAVMGTGLRITRPGGAGEVNVGVAGAAVSTLTVAVDVVVSGSVRR